MIPTFAPAHHPWTPVIQTILTLKGASHVQKKTPVGSYYGLKYPIYQDDEIHLDHPLIIMDYLDEKYPSPSIYPCHLAHKHTMRYLLALFIDRSKTDVLSWLMDQISALPAEHQRPCSPPSPFDLFLICHADLTNPLLKKWSDLRDAIELAQRHLLRQAQG